LRDKQGFLNSKPRDLDSKLSSIVHRRLKELTDERGWFTLQRIRRDLADQFFKFQSLAAGGVFIHIPFMTSTDLSESERISAFR